MLDYSKNMLSAIVNAKKEGGSIEKITELLEEYAGSDFNKERVNQNIIEIVTWTGSTSSLVFFSEGLKKSAKIFSKKFSRKS